MGYEPRWERDFSHVHKVLMYQTRLEPISLPICVHTPHRLL